MEELPTAETSRQVYDRMIFQDRDSRLFIPDTKVAVVTDLHLPLTMMDLYQQFLEDIKRLEVTSVIIAGDLMDMHPLSRHDTTDFTYLYSDTKKLCRKIVEEILHALGTGGQVTISLGNHDNNWMRSLKYQDDMDGLYRSVGLGSLIDNGDVCISDNPVVEFMELDGEPQWLAVHPGQYKSPFGFGGQFAQAERRNVIAGHAHHFGHTVDPTGRYHVIESGGMFDETKFDYTHRFPTTMRKMVPGYWIMREDDEPIGVCGLKLGPRAQKTPTRTLVRTR